MSDLSGLNIGLSALYAQRRGLEVTGQNIANANTEGYTRQRVRLASDGGPTMPAVHSRWDGAGNGVDVQDVQRLRNVFLETRGVQERGNEASLRAGQTVLSRIEDVLGEPGDSGLQSVLAEFWSGWDDVANRPTDLAARSQLLQQATTVTDGLNRVASQLDQLWTNGRSEIAGTVDVLNTTAANVAELNRAISTATKAGLSPNDLTDQRDRLVQQLAETAGVSVRPGEAGAVDVYLQGTALVRGSEASALAVRGSLTPTTPPTAVSVVWDHDGRPAPVGGHVGGLLQAVNDVVPRYRADVDAVAVALRDVVNAVHTASYDQSGAPGVPFFSGTSAADLTVAVQQPGQIAASSVPGGGRDGSAAARAADLAGAAAGPDRLYRGLVVRLGVESQSASRRVEIQAGITAQVDAAREAESGVNLDEEMMSMIAYQHAYEGAARYITAIDQMLDTLINRTGLVGR